MHMKLHINRKLIARRFEEIYKSYLVTFRLVKAHVNAYLAVTITHLSFTLLSGNESIFRFVLYNKY